MKAMILAAGKGTRVRPITYTVPKPMISIINKPVMEFLIEHLKVHGFDQIMVNTSHLASKIEEYFKDGSRWGVQIGYSFEGKIENGDIKGIALGSAGGMKKIQQFSGFFDETFVVLCGDAIIDLDLTKALNFHRQKKALATIIMQDVPKEEVSSYGVVVTDSDGKIVQFQEKPAVEEALSTTINTGIYIFEPKILDFIPMNTEYDIGGQLFPLLVEKKIPFYGVTIPYQWIDIGNAPDYWRAIQKALSGGINGFTVPGIEARPGVWTGINTAIDWPEIEIQPPVYIGSSTKIESGSQIVGPTSIGNGCHIKQGAIVRKSVIGEYTRVGQFAQIDKKIIFGNHCIDVGGQTTSINEAAIGWVVNDARYESIHFEELEKDFIELIKETVNEYAAAIRAACSMGNANNLQELRRNVRAIRVSTMSQEESDPIAGEL